MAEVSYTVRGELFTVPADFVVNTEFEGDVVTVSVTYQMPRIQYELSSNTLKVWPNN